MKKCDWLGTHVTWPTQVWHFCTMNKRLFEISRTPTREILKYTIYTCLVTQHDEYDVCTIFVLRRDTVIKGVMSVCVIDRAVYNLIGKVRRCYILYMFLCDVSQKPADFRKMSLFSCKSKALLSRTYIYIDAIQPTCWDLALQSL